MINNIILTGFMGSGKSSIGRILANELNNFYFLDTDSLIEISEKRAISDIFEKEGEEFFRDLERKTFLWIKDSVKNGIISTGGGLPMFVPEIREAGIVFYLEVEFDEIVSRLTKEEIETRPLFKDLDKAKELFDKRDKIYRKLAHHIIENRNLKNTISEIKTIIDA